MPAAAVIPAPIAYIKVVAVKTLVVGFLILVAEPAMKVVCLLKRSNHLSGDLFLLFIEEF